MAKVWSAAKIATASTMEAASAADNSDDFSPLTPGGFQIHGEHGTKKPNLVGEHGKRNEIV